MKRIGTNTLSLVVLLTLAIALSFTANGQAQELAGRIHAGPYGKFVETPHSVTTEGYSDFSANIKLFTDGTAAGEFICAVDDLIVVAVAAETWVANEDGSINVTGPMYGIFADTYDTVTDCNTIITFRAGGPGVGGFDVDFTCLFPEGMYDTEVVKFGRVQITSN